METPLLEIHLHLANGAMHTFVQNDPKLARQILEQISPKVFTQNSLVVAGEDQVATYYGASLIGISIVMEHITEELLRLDRFPPMREITESDYYARQNPASGLGGMRPFTLLNAIEFANGRRLYLESHIPQAACGFEERQIIHHAFSWPSIVSRRLGGGISLWNRAHMIKCTFFPKPEVPANTWSAELVTA